MPIVLGRARWAARGEPFGRPVLSLPKGSRPASRTTKKCQIRSPFDNCRANGGGVRQENESACRIGGYTLNGAIGIIPPVEPVSGELQLCPMICPGY